VNAQPGVLGDTAERAYDDKLELLSRFMEPELRAVIAGLELRPGERVLDAGCGIGLTTAWLAEQVAPDGEAVGVDLAGAHVIAAERLNGGQGLPLRFMQGDIMRLPFAEGFFDLIWSSNTINHLPDPPAAARALGRLLRPGGRLVLGAGLFLQELHFAWDARLERAVTDACHSYYRAKYGLDERMLTGWRADVGLLRAAGYIDVAARTHVIERVSPLSASDERYFAGYYANYWAHRVQPYLDSADWEQLRCLCDPASPDFAPRRPDFHFMQTYTVIQGRRAGEGA
jgi:SAM-dependent methyltransferase